jgi:hypothetical protein
MEAAAQLFRCLANAQSGCAIAPWDDGRRSCHAGAPVEPCAVAGGLTAHTEPRFRASVCNHCPAASALRCACKPVPEPSAASRWSGRGVHGGAPAARLRTHTGVMWSNDWKVYRKPTRAREVSGPPVGTACPRSWPWRPPPRLRDESSPRTAVTASLRRLRGIQANMGTNLAVALQARALRAKFC